MKYFTFANETNECYGHGDYGTELRIIKHGGYGTGDFPPLFTTKRFAQDWLNRQEIITKNGMVIVELEVKY